MGVSGDSETQNVEPDGADNSGRCTALLSDLGRSLTEMQFTGKT